MNTHADDHLRLTAGDGGLGLGPDGAFRSISRGAVRVELPYARTQLGLEGVDCEAEAVSGNDGVTLRLTGRRASGTALITSGREVRIQVTADEEPQGTAAVTRRASLSFALPVDACLHLAEFQNVGRRIDASMPEGEWFSCRTYYNCAVIETGGLALRARSDHRDTRQLEVEIQRHPDSFTVTFTWSTAGSLCLAVFATRHDAMADLVGLLRERFGVRTLTERYPRTPWLPAVKLVVTADMMRSNGDIVHDYADVAALARSLRRIDCPRETVLYLPGWNGPYDSGGPTYGPAESLGGPVAFQSMVDTIHASGFRVMIHTTGWGIDPYHPHIDELEPLVVRDEDGELKGWQVNGKWSPSNRTLHFRTPAIPLAAREGSKAMRRDVEIQSPPVPDWCEALITIGGLRGTPGRIRVSSGSRSVSTPEGWLQGNDACDLPYPLQLHRGANAIRFEAGAGIDWSSAWYRVRHSFRPTSGYSSWTWPILMADTSDPGYIDRFTSSVCDCVRRYGIDMVHIDAITLGWPDKSERFLRTVSEALGDVPVAGETTSRLDEIGFWALMQNGAQSLLATRGRESLREQQSLAMHAGVDELLAWVDRESDVCDFAASYMKSYPHLCAACAFVPVGKVCNVFPSRKVPLHDAELWAALRDAGRLRCTPGVRVNYREHGLDPQMTAAIREIVTG